MPALTGLTLQVKKTGLKVGIKSSRKVTNGKQGNSLFDFDRKENSKCSCFNESPAKPEVTHEHHNISISLVCVTVRINRHFGSCRPIPMKLSPPKAF